ncbi:flagellar transcriptional activator FlhC [Sodalis glossinidius str. 'morsitans']|uniref:Flagellar transcriptional regulator FlhC n=2 Tax=Sodalis glossinidius (strain morsitans) TaxID=343509 RepID=FLHC_SODGM|nr:flagellar transcriptional regulator FlhC [Sodalis glossinidius]Q2NX28.1 RecName: Full=Flagellar transcriptional regulator FlhC [Sodalis glossinidius str. 'morsitans']BAE73297.1 flagellar transcriptional activator FlhC [Sodalis glossinidius str. 'morsitans']
MYRKSIMQESRDIQLAMELIALGARLPILENETCLSRSRLLRLYKEVKGTPAPKGLLPFSADWFLSWEQNIHSSAFYNAYLCLIRVGNIPTIEAMIKAYRLYLELCPQRQDGGPLLGLTRAWILLRFIDSQLLGQTRCKLCGGAFITYAFHPPHNFVCSFCHPPSRAVKKRKLSHAAADNRIYNLRQRNMCNVKPC